MINYYVYAKDFSGSTQGVEYYHRNGLKTLELFKSEVDKIEQEQLAAGEPPPKSKVIYLHWNNNCKEVDEYMTRSTYENNVSECSGTQPETIIDYLKENYIKSENDHIKLLYIITDGLISPETVQICYNKNEDMHYETVIFHAFNQCLHGIDLSVAASFLKGRCMVFRNFELNDSTDISKQFDYQKINYDNFEAEKNELTSYIKLKFMRYSNKDAKALQEIEELKKLRNRLFQEYSSKLEGSEKAEVRLLLDTKDKSTFLSEFVKTDWYKDLFSSTHADKVDVEKYISTLINYIVSDAKSYSFDALKFNKKYNKPVEEEQIAVVDFESEEEIEFPDVILTEDKGIPVVLLTEFNLISKIIFHNTQWSKEAPPASFNKFKTTMECPLFLMKDKDVSESIGYFYTLNVYKELLAHDTKTDPRTRKPFHGGIVLTSTDQFDKYNDYILSQTYFSGKKVNYNVGLFYFVLWKNCENKEWMDRNVVEQFKKYAMRRISETTCYIGLSSLPLDPQEKTSLLTALWYCVELSSCIFKNDPINYKQERIRMYHGVAHHMIEILKYFKYDLDIESINKRMELLTYVSVLKKIQNRREKVYHILKEIFKTADGFLISEIAKPFNLYKLNYLKYHHKEMLRDDVIDEEVHLNDYVHLMHFAGNLDGKATFEICQKTFRPFFAIDRDKSFYTELVKNTRKVVINNDNDKDKIEVSYQPIDTLEFNRILSLYKLFISYVKRSGKYPTLPEFVEYISEGKKFNESLVTIFPPNVYLGIKDVHDRYQNIIKEVAVEEFIKTCATYAGRTNRIIGEESVKFSDENEIATFIACEESKVNLKKSPLP